MDVIHLRGTEGWERLFRGAELPDDEVNLDKESQGHRRTTDHRDHKPSTPQPA